MSNLLFIIQVNNNKITIKTKNISIYWYICSFYLYKCYRYILQNKVYISDNVFQRKIGHRWSSCLCRGGDVLLFHRRSKGSCNLRENNLYRIVHVTKISVYMLIVIRRFRSDIFR